MLDIYYADQALDGFVAQPDCLLGVHGRSAQWIAHFADVVRKRARDRGIAVDVVIERSSDGHALTLRPPGTEGDYLLDLRSFLRYLHLLPRLCKRKLGPRECGSERNSR